jgi:hypothetical protein
MVDNSKELEASIGNVEQVVKPVELPPKPEQTLEVESWMEKIERKFSRVPNKTNDVTDDSVIVQQPTTQQPPVTLPVNHLQMQQGKQAKTDTGIAWLVAWAIRQIKQLTTLGRGVRLQDIPEAK